MSHPSIAQAAMLADHFERLVLRYMPRSLALIGCAGGNGLERLASGQVARIVAVDINPRYVEQTGIRHGRRLQNLELRCADVQSAALAFEPVELLYAALLFEYVDVAVTLAALRRHCRAGAILATALQLPYASQAAVSASPYASLGALAAAISLVAPAELTRSAAGCGFSLLDSASLVAPAGKEFCFQTFRSI